MKQFEGDVRQKHIILLCFFSALMIKSPKKDRDVVQHKGSKTSCNICWQFCKILCGIFLTLRSVRSRAGFPFSAGNPSVCGNSPQKWSQQQAESGDAEDQQVHLSMDRETEKKENKSSEDAIISSYTKEFKDIQSAVSWLKGTNFSASAHFVQVKR